MGTRFLLAALGALVLTGCAQPTASVPQPSSGQTAVQTPTGLAAKLITASALPAGFVLDEDRERPISEVAVAMGTPDGADILRRRGFQGAWIRSFLADAPAGQPGNVSVLVSLYDRVEGAAAGLAGNLERVRTSREGATAERIATLRDDGALFRARHVTEDGVLTVYIGVFRTGNASVSLLVSGMGSDVGPEMALAVAEAQRQLLAR